MDQELALENKLFYFEAEPIRSTLEIFHLGMLKLKKEIMAYLFSSGNPFILQLNLFFALLCLS